MTFLTPNPGNSGLAEGCETTSCPKLGQYAITRQLPAYNQTTTTNTYSSYL